MSRVRHPEGEVEFETYKRIQDPSIFHSQVFEQGLKHVSQRDDEKGLPQIAASFGVNKSTVSRSWLKSTSKPVEKLLNRDLKSLDINAFFIDGKRFSKLGVVIPLGVGSDGRKHVLGIYQSSTENSAACLGLLEDLERRGLDEKGTNEAEPPFWAMRDARNLSSAQVSFEALEACLKGP